MGLSAIASLAVTSGLVRGSGVQAGSRRVKHAGDGDIQLCFCLYLNGCLPIILLIQVQTAKSENQSGDWQPGLEQQCLLKVIFII